MKEEMTNSIGCRKVLRQSLFHLYSPHAQYSTQQTLNWVALSLTHTHYNALRMTISQSALAVLIFQLLLLRDSEIPSSTLSRDHPQILP